MVDWAGVLATAACVPLAGTLLRLVESQEQVATNQLVSTLTRQSLLEDMLERTKPPLRPDTGRLHYLLATPFRYPPLKHGSRFGRRSEPSLCYGSQETRTVLAEAAYYRFIFWYGMTVAPAGKLDTQHTLFGAAYRSDRGMQLQAAAFAHCAEVLRHRSDYGPTQELGGLLREIGIEAFEFVSARDAEQGINVALVTPAAFADRAPLFQEAWLCELTDRQVHFQAVHSKAAYRFPVETFQVDGALPWPAP